MDALVQNKYSFGYQSEFSKAEMQTVADLTCRSTLRKMW